GFEERGAAVAGAVCDPLRDELFAGAAGAGCTLNGVPIATRGDGRLVATFVHPRRVWGAVQVGAVLAGLAEAGFSPRVTGCGGTGASAAKRSSPSATRASSVARSASGALCGEAQAPTCAPRGRVAKYASLSSSGSVEAAPVTRTWR